MKASLSGKGAERQCTMLLFVTSPSGYVSRLVMWLCHYLVFYASFFCDERAVFAHVSSHQEYVHIQANTMLRLFSANRVTCSLYTHHGLSQLILFTGKFRTCFIDSHRARNLETCAGLVCIRRCYPKPT